MRRRAKQVLKVLLVVFWVGSGINHFLRPDFYIGIMPDYLPWHRGLVYLSGATEIAAGLLVAVPATTRYGVWFIYAHLLVFMTVHIYMIQYASERFADIPVALLWLRLPLQALFAYWAYWCTKPEPEEDDSEPPANEDALAA